MNNERILQINQIFGPRISTELGRRKQKVLQTNTSVREGKQLIYL